MVRYFKHLVFDIFGGKRLECRLEDNDPLIEAMLTAVKGSHVESSAFYPNRLRLNQVCFF